MCVCVCVCVEWGGGNLEWLELSSGLATNDNFLPYFLKIVYFDSKFQRATGSKVVVSNSKKQLTWFLFWDNGTV
jgi:hypothetical protein